VKVNVKEDAIVLKITTLFVEEMERLTKTSALPDAKIWILLEAEFVKEPTKIVVVLISAILFVVLMVKFTTVLVLLNVLIYLSILKPGVYKKLTPTLTISTN
jgi:hypothetical protein